LKPVIRIFGRRFLAAMACVRFTAVINVISQSAHRIIPRVVAIRESACGTLLA